jgi:hypothetical protein
MSRGKRRPHQGLHGVRDEPGAAADVGHMPGAEMVYRVLQREQYARLLAIAAAEAANNQRDDQVAAPRVSRGANELEIQQDHNII